MLSPTARSDLADGAAPERSATWPLVVFLVIAAVVLFALQRRRPQAIEPLVGLALPQLEVGGWINSETPLAPTDLRGQVVLVDFWMTTCGPCVREMPKLVHLQQQFRDQGLKVVGLTPEQNDSGHVSEFVERMPGVNWPIGYGAGFTFQLTGIEATPTYILYDRTGRSVWASHSLYDAKSAIIAALAK